MNCGPSHRTEVREILQLRDPGAPVSTSNDPAALAFDRALIIDDFLRLKSSGESRALAGSAVRLIDEALLRRLRDSGRVTSEVCAVVRFMHRHYAGDVGAPDVAAAPPAIAPGSSKVTRKDLQAEKAEKPAAAPRPREKPRAPEPAPAEVPPATPAPKPLPPAPAVAEPAPAEPAAEAEAPAPIDVAAIERDALVRSERAEQERQAAENEAALRRSALALIAEIEKQLKVPRYLSFKDARIETPDLPKDELERRREASLRASERVIALLDRMREEPGLREAVHAALGPEGRARLEDAILRSFKSLPDSEQRAHALQLWFELEASVRRTR